MDQDKPNCLLLRDCAEKLTAAGRTPFTRQELIDCVRQTKPDANADSLNPMIQGITVGLKGGAPGGVGKKVLWRVGRGLFELYNGQDGGEVHAGTDLSTPSSGASDGVGVDAPTPSSSRTRVYSGDSSAQRQAESWLRNEASVALGATLVKRRLTLACGAALEMDGYCAEPPVLCEIWARIGSPKAAQKHKVMTDALKLVYARDALLPGARCVLVFGSAEAAGHFQGASWMAACLADRGIEVLVLEMPAALRDRVLVAQRRQYR